MPLQTRLTDAFGIEHPILLAPMDLVASGKLAAAVSHAGGLGLIGGGYGNAEWLEQEFAAAGNAKVGCGFITWSLAKKPDLLDVALQHQPAAVMLSFGDPGSFAHKIKEAGAKLICQVQSLAQAREAATAGADILVAQGTEAGGHGATRTTLTLVPEIIDAFPHLPVVASGGIADGRGLAAVLMLGADGVLMGTRFYASQEAQGHPEAKQRIIDASGDDTLRSIVFDISRRNLWPQPYTGRVIRNAHAERWYGHEAELLEHQEEEVQRYAEARERGDFDVAAVIAGEAVGLIHDAPSAAEIVDRTILEAEARIARGTRLIVS
ncbi:NAD(P)H-dependent flavin oxidoreductase [Microvirga yunnanensis]|uniref:NAD(P)H-dependent flavin oxidoreductase n=1 Tax=Microvirga yunnanensis TaxID=2953740 RepID=UPI0021C5DFA7|nr:nitronate monooxygenase [Microvirga sp. HBU65207]